MKIMESTVQLFRVVGIGNHALGFREYLTRFIIIFVLILNPCPQVIYLFANIDNIVEVAFSIYYVVVGYGNLSQYCVLVYHEAEVWDLFQTIERMVEEKSFKNGFAYFANIKEFLKTVMSISQKGTWFIYVIYVSSPLLIILHAYFAGSLTEGLFVAPLRDLYYFFDATSSPLFELCYLMNMFKLSFVVLIFIVVDVAFVELCFYIITMYEELKAMLRRLKAVQPDKALINLNECIIFHTEIINIIHRAAKFIDPIVGAQLIYSFLTLATNTFTALYVQPQEYPKMVSSCGCFVAELFIYCYLGSRVLDKAEEVQLTFYDLPWYDYPVEKQRSIRMLMMHTTYCQPGFSAFKYIYCNIATFGMMMSKVYSALAFLQNLI